VSIAETDSDLADNLATLEVPFTFDPNIYARDDGNFVDGGVGTGAQTAIFAQNFDFINAAVINGMLYAYEAGVVGDVVNGIIYSMDAAGMPDTVVATTEPFALTAAGVSGSPEFVTLEFAELVELEAGTYFFAIEQTTANSMNISFSNTVYTEGTVFAGLLDQTGNFGWTPFEDFNLRLALSIRPLIVNVGVGTNDPDVNYVNELEISPNPTNGFVTVDLELFETQDLTVEVLNTNGQVIKMINENNSLGGQYQLNLTEFPNGIYFVKFQIGNQLISKKVVLTN